MIMTNNDTGRTTDYLAYRWKELLLFAAAVFLLIAVRMPSQAQSTGEADSSATPATAPTPSPTPIPQGFATGLTGRIHTRERNAPLRENQTVIGLGTKHFNALIGGMQQGAGFDFGVEATTADRLPGVELRVQAVTSTRFYRRFEAAAYVPKLGDEKTHAEVWFSYQRRTRDHFFGIGPLYPKTEQTNYDVESRSYNVEAIPAHPDGGLSVELDHSSSSTAAG